MGSENPWWVDPDPASLPFSSLVPRPYLGLLFPLVSSTEIRRAVVLMGPRRVGKTVIVHHAIARLLAAGVPPRRVAYVSVDHPIYNRLGLEELLDVYLEASGAVRGEGPCFVFFDEIQYLRDWEIHLKVLVDSRPELKCVVSGSAAAALRLKSVESGAGRFTEFLLPPLTFHEYLRLLGEEDLAGTERAPDDFGEASDLPALNGRFLHYLNFGGYPEVVLSPSIQADPGRFVRSDIIDKVLLRDLPSLYGIHDVQELNALFTSLAFNTGREVALEDLSKRSGVAKNTIKKYIEYLEAAYLLRVVHRVDRGARRFQRARAFKVFLTNPSLRAALFSPVDADDPATGALVETAAFAQWFHSGTTLHYARWESGEVDMVSVGGDQRIGWAAEVKWSDRAAERPEELAALLTFCRETGLREAVITSRSFSGRQAHRGVVVRFVPAAQYCAAVGRGLVEGRVGPRIPPGP